MLIIFIHQYGVYLDYYMAGIIVFGKGELNIYMQSPISDIHTMYTPPPPTTGPNFNLPAVHGVHY